MTTDNILLFPKIHRTENAAQALEVAKGWDFQQVFIVEYMDNAGPPAGTIIQSVSPNALNTAKDQLFMAELLRHMALKSTGLI